MWPWLLFRSVHCEGGNLRGHFLHHLWWRRAGHQEECGQGGGDPDPGQGRLLRGTGDKDFISETKLKHSLFVIMWGGTRGLTKHLMWTKRNSLKNKTEHDGQVFLAAIPWYFVGGKQSRGLNWWKLICIHSLLFRIHLRIHLLKTLLHFRSQWMFESWSLKFEWQCKVRLKLMLDMKQAPLK